MASLHQIKNRISSLRRKRQWIYRYTHVITLCSLLSLPVFQVSDAKASLYLHSFSGIASGDLNNSPFSESAFTLTSVFDSSDVYSPSFNVFAVPSITTIFSMSGYQATLSDIPLMDIFNKTNFSVGISSPPRNTGDKAVIFFLDSFRINGFLKNDPFELIDFNLGSSIAPILGDAIQNSDTYFSTNLGPLKLNSVSNLAFTASPIPEDSSYSTLFGLAVFAAVAIRRSVKSSSLTS